MCGCFENYSIFLQVLLGCGIVVGYCLCLYFGFASLLNISICTRVVVAVTFEQVDNTPNAETGTKSNNESLENTNSRVKKCHRLNIAERKECRYEYPTDHRICRSALLSKILACLIFESGRSVFGILDLY